MTKKLEYLAYCLGIFLPATIPILAGIHFQWPEGVQVSLAAAIIIFQIYYLSRNEAEANKKNIELENKMLKQSSSATNVEFLFEENRQESDKPLVFEILRLLHEKNPMDKITFIKNWLLRFPSETIKYNDKSKLEKDAVQIYNWHSGNIPLPPHCSMPKKYID